LIYERSLSRILMLTFWSELRKPKARERDRQSGTLRRPRQAREVLAGRQKRSTGKKSKRSGGIAGEYWRVWQALGKKTLLGNAQKGLEKTTR
jgi:hypothetical protein